MSYYYNDCIMVREQRQDELRDINLRTLLRKGQPSPNSLVRALRRSLAAMGRMLVAMGDSLQADSGTRSVDTCATVERGRRAMVS